MLEKGKPPRRYQDYTRNPAPLSNRGGALVLLAPPARPAASGDPGNEGSPQRTARGPPVRISQITGGLSYSRRQGPAVRAGERTAGCAGKAEVLRFHSLPQVSPSSVSGSTTRKTGQLCATAPRSAPFLRSARRLTRVSGRPARALRSGGKPRPLRSAPNERSPHTRKTTDDGRAGCGSASTRNLHQRLHARKRCGSLAEKPATSAPGAPDSRRNGSLGASPPGGGPHSALSRLRYAALTLPAARTLEQPRPPDHPLVRDPLRYGAGCCSGGPPPGFRALAGAPSAPVAGWVW